MLSSDSAKHSAHEAQLDRIFRALSDPTRRQLLTRLRGGSETVTDLARPFAMSLPAVGKHIRVLETAGLVERTISGRVHRCALNAMPLKDAGAWLAHYQRFWDETLDALSDYLQEDARGADRGKHRAKK